MSKLAVVVGATGGQGGSAITALLADGSFKVRGLTRNVKGEKAIELASTGVEMVTADLSDEESLVKAFQGATHIFAMTNFFDSFWTKSSEECMEIEIGQGINMAKAAAQIPTLQHYIWSTLPDAFALTGGQVRCPHTDGKAKVDDFIRQDEKLCAKTTFLWTGVFIETFKFPVMTPHFLKAAGKSIFMSVVDPSTPTTFIGDHRVNLGPFVAAIFNQPHLTLGGVGSVGSVGDVGGGGRYVLASVGTYTLHEVIQMLSEASGGKEIVDVRVDLETLNKLFPKFALEVGSNYQVFDICREKSWSSHPFIGAEELGIADKLVGFKESLLAMDWSELA